MELQHVLKLQEEGNMKSLLKPNQSTNPKEKKQIVSGVWEGLRQNVTWANYLRAKRPPNSFQRPRPYWSGARRSAQPHPGQTSGDIKPRFTVEDNRRILAAETTLHAPAVSPSAWACHLHPPSRWYNVPHQKQPCRFLMFSVRKNWPNHTWALITTDFQPSASGSISLALPLIRRCPGKSTTCAGGTLSYQFCIDQNLIQRVNLVHFSICACHPCAGAMLIFSVSFQFYRMIPEGNPKGIRREYKEYFVDTGPWRRYEVVHDHWKVLWFQPISWN